jgi:alpha-tubulin suppressor-like RCC1 family protein
MTRARLLVCVAAMAALPAFAWACGPAPDRSPKTPQTIVAAVASPSPPGSAPALRTTNPAPELSHARAFELVAGWQLCAIVKDTLHCRDAIKLDKPLALEPPAIANVAVTSASFGRDFGCVVTRTGAVECYGGNHFGQLGANVREEKHDEPLVLPKITDAKRVVSGPMHACAILASGKVACWGKNQFGENGSATQYLEAARELVEPEIVPGVEDVRELALAWDATCAVTSRKEVWCWGRSKTDEQRAARGDASEVAAPDLTLFGVTSIVANESSFCGVKDGSVVCWGETYMLDAAGPRKSAMRFEVPGATRVSLGANHGCALSSSGAVYCFGSNYNGELGVPKHEGDYTPHAPAKVEDLPYAVDIVCGSSFSCAVTARDEVFCWGRFNWQQNDEGAMSATPVKLRVVD